jgi:hypothetical protein
VAFGLLQADGRTKGDNHKANGVIAGILRCKCSKYKCMQRMLISIKHVLFKGCRSWLVVMYSTPLTAKAPCYLQHATMNSRSLFCTAHHYEQSLLLLYRTIRAIAPCHLQHVSNNSRSLFCTAHHYEQSLPVLYSRTLTAICPSYQQHTTMNSRSFFCSESQYEKSFPPYSYVQTGSIKY